MTPLRRLIQWALAPVYKRHSRWYRAWELKELEKKNTRLKKAMKHCGKNVFLNGRIKIIGIEQLVLGDNVHIGNNAWIQARGGLTIGDHTHISQNLVLHTVNHNYEGGRLPYDDSFTHHPVTIGKNVWIGINVTIAPGTTIGDGAIIAMGTTVFGEVPPLAIVGNEKWRILGYRDSSRYEALESAEMYGGRNGKPYDG